MTRLKPHPITEFNKKYTLVTHKDAISAHPERLETYGADLLTLDDFKKTQIWSILNQDGNFILKAGKFLIGLVGYAVTSESWDVKGTEFTAAKKLHI